MLPSVSDGLLYSLRLLSPLTQALLELALKYSPNIFNSIKVRWIGWPLHYLDFYELAHLSCMKKFFLSLSLSKKAGNPSSMILIYDLVLPPPSSLRVPYIGLKPPYIPLIKSPHNLIYISINFNFFIQSFSNFSIKYHKTRSLLFQPSLNGWRGCMIWISQKGWRRPSGVEVAALTIRLSSAVVFRSCTPWIWLLV